MWLAPHMMTLAPPPPAFSSSKCQKYNNYDKALYRFLLPLSPPSQTSSTGYWLAPTQTNFPRPDGEIKEELLNCTFFKTLSNN